LEGGLNAVENTTATRKEQCVGTLKADERDANAYTLIRQMARCKMCGLVFMVVDWLPWRTKGYCSKHCLPWRDSPAGKDGAV
jgi:hypothetical protein